MANAPTISVLPTIYKGIKFRSRTEARWAVYLDTLGVEWEYEAEGYQLPDGSRYLPDFWLPRQEWFIEVKPESNDGEAKAEQLALMTYRPVFVTDGSPRSRAKEPWDEGQTPYWEVPWFRVCNPNRIIELPALRGIEALVSENLAKYRSLPEDNRKQLKDDLDGEAYSYTPWYLDPLDWESAIRMTPDGIYPHWWDRVLWRRGEQGDRLWARAGAGWTWTIWDMASSPMYQDAIHTWGIDEQRQAVRAATSYRFWNPGGE